MRSLRGGLQELLTVALQGGKQEERQNEMLHKRQSLVAKRQDK